MKLSGLVAARVTASVCVALSAMGCSSAPSVDVERWALTRDDDGEGYLFTASAKLLDGEGGWFSPRLTLTDERGCKSFQALDPINPISSPDPSEVDGQYREQFDYKWRIASAQLNLVHTTSEGSGFAEEVVFSDEKVIDPSLSPPAMPEKPCTPPGESRREQLREKAKTDPDRADADAIADMSRDELMATAINTAGYLCAKVTDMYPSGGAIVVSCTEYRNGKGRVRYRVDTDTMTVEQID